MSDFEDCSDDIQCLGRCITVKPFNTPKMKTCVVFLFELKLSLYLAFINVSSKQDPSIFKKITPPPLTTFSKLADIPLSQTNATNPGDPAGEYQREARGAEAPWLLHGSDGSMESSNEDQNPGDLEPGMMLIWVFPKMVVPNNHGFSYY